STLRLFISSRANRFFREEHAVSLRLTKGSELMEAGMEQLAAMAEPIIDDHMIQACQQGDREAFRLLFEAYKDRVFSIAVYSFGGDHVAASDITQQIFLKLLTTIGQFRGESQFTTWLHRLVVNSCIDEQRRRQRFLRFEESGLMNRTRDRKSHERRYERMEMTDSVKAAVSELKPKFRMAVLLKYVEGLSYEEIAKVLGCSKGTVASRLNRSHKELARRLAHLRDEVILGD
ncbi:MAG: RNA polymerase sigma factor, partial [Pyrinomonadaceae bacterium]